MFAKWSSKLTVFGDHFEYFCKMSPVWSSFQCDFGDHFVNSEMNKFRRAASDGDSPYNCGNSIHYNARKNLTIKITDRMYVSTDTSLSFPVNTLISV